MLLAVGEGQSYFAGGSDQPLDVPWDHAIDQYGQSGLPARDEVYFRSWDGRPVLAGAFAEPDPRCALPFVRCAAAAMPMLGLSAVDMLVLLIGPPGVDRDLRWMRAAATIETDDRVCRRMVWLPGTDQAASASDFLGRSPFAKPWLSMARDRDAPSLERILSEEHPLDEVAIRADRSAASAEEFLKSVLESVSK